MKTVLTFFLCIHATLLIAQTSERITMRVDKPYYLAGQAIGFEAEVLDGKTLEPTQQSTPLYVEWIDLKNGKLLEHQAIKIQNGKASLTLRTSDKLSSGYYQIRACTNWMRNFYIPTQNVLVLGINYEKDITATKVDTTISYFLQNPSLVANIVNRIAISAKNTYDKPLETTAFLLNSKKDTLLDFRTDKQGVGIVEFTPKLGENYRVVIGSEQYELPKIVSEGNVLLTNIQKDASIESFVKVLVQSTTKPNHDSLNLVIHQRGKIVNSLQILMKKPSIWLNIDKKELQAGILNISLLDANKKVLTEQMLYLDSTNIGTRSKQALIDAEVGENVDSLLSPVLINRKLQTLQKNFIQSLLEQSNSSLNMA